MDKKNAHAAPQKNSPPHASPPCRDHALHEVLRFLRQGPLQGRHDDAPAFPGMRAELAEALRCIRQLQDHLSLLARGEISEPITLEGYTGDLLRELRENLLQVIRQARRLTVGDFSRDAGSMGEVSEAFEVMGKTLQAAFMRLEQQKRDLTHLSENLQREIDARAAVEEDLRREQAQLQKLAATDPLTGLANRRHFFQTAIRELERIRRNDTPACLAMLDIDHFKALNDNLGHGAGDAALCDIARIITGAIRPYDLAGRHGGDEFIFLFLEITPADAHALLERLRSAVERARISTGAGAAVLTVSIGLTGITADGSASSGVLLDQAIIRADKALYKAKEKSRNHICIA